MRATKCASSDPTMRKRSNVRGVKGPLFRTNARSRKGHEIGKPNNSGKCSETANGVACQSEGRTRVPVLGLLRTGHQQVIDADLSGYFDSIPHSELMKCVARRVRDKHVLHLIKMWLDAPVEEEDEHGNRKRTTSNRDAGRGMPQGAVISPLLSNLYMRRFILGWKKLGYARRWSAHIVNYADDYVICCKGQAEEAMNAMRGMMKQLKLTVNEQKTHVCRLPQERFDFLGYTFGRCYSPKTGHAYISVRPSKKSIKRMVGNITLETRRSQMPMETDVMVDRLNRKMNGWANYFCLGPINSSYRALNCHAVQRLRRWLCKKHKVEGKGYKHYPDQHLHDTLGLVYLPGRSTNLLWAKA